MCVCACAVNFIPWHGDSSCDFEASDIKQDLTSMGLQVSEQFSHLKQSRLRCPHRSCGGRDIFCFIDELRELGHLGLTLRFGALALDFVRRPIGRLSGGKR